MSTSDAFEIVLRPRVPMPYATAVAPLAALAVCEQLGDGAQILWPSSVMLDGAVVARIAAKAGYDEGIFVRLSIALTDSQADRTAIADAIQARFDAWEQAVCAGRAAAGPFGPFAGEYFDRMAGLGGTVDLLFPNGNLYCKATLEGIDVWGRICVETDDGRDVEYSPEQVSMRLA